MVLETVRGVLADQPAVVFGYAFGSFLQDRPFHDLDVAVYLDTMTLADASAFALDLAATLERAVNRVLNKPGVHLPVEVRILNDAPLGFRYHAFQGELVFSRDESLRIHLVERTVCRYLDLKPLRRQALKEAMTA